MAEVFSLNSSSGDEEKSESVSNAVPKSTERSTNWGVKKFKAWAAKSGNSIDFDSVTPHDFNVILRKFYAEVKGDDGTDLSHSGLRGVRAALHRNLTTTHGRDFNIMVDGQFTPANIVFKARCKKLREDDTKKPEHKPCIEDGDMQKLGVYFGDWNKHPTVLYEALWFNLCYNFGHRGREGWCEMNKSTLDVRVDSAEQEYVCFTSTNNTTKPGQRRSQIGYSKQRMYGLGVKIYKFYCRKLNPNCSRLFQLPLRIYKADGPWYKNSPIGKNTFGTIMKNISRKAGLSKEYTCHSVKASTITHLFHAGVSPQGICEITNHRNEASLKHYISSIPEDQKMDCARILTDKLDIPQVRSLLRTIRQIIMQRLLLYLKNYVSLVVYIIKV